MDQSFPLVVLVSISVVLGSLYQLSVVWKRFEALPERRYAKATRKIARLTKRLKKGLAQSTRLELYWKIACEERDHLSGRISDQDGLASEKIWSALEDARDAAADLRARLDDLDVQHRSLQHKLSVARTQQEQADKDRKQDHS